MKQQEKENEEKKERVWQEMYAKMKNKGTGRGEN